jgi:hypothetical protein
MAFIGKPIPWPDGFLSRDSQHLDTGTACHVDRPTGSRLMDSTAQMPLACSRRTLAEAGLAEMFEHRYGDDPRRMLEHVYRAMFYASEAASSISASR